MAENLVQGIKETLWLPNTIKELKQCPTSAKVMGVFLLVGIMLYYFLLGDFTFWGNLAVIGLVFSAINLVLVDSQKITSYLWGILTSVCSIIGAFHYQMFGDVGYYLWVFPWMIWGIGEWYKLGKESDGDTQSLSLPKKDIPKYVVLMIVSYLAMFAISTIAGGAVPIVDSLILCFGVVGQVFLSKSYKEQWIVWIAQDVAALVAWSIRLSMALAAGQSITYAIAMIINWGIFTVNAIYGCYSWYKISKDA